MTAWTPLTCMPRILFLYLWPKVRSVPWPLHYKTWGKIKMIIDTCLRIGTVQIYQKHAILEHPWWSRCVVYNSPLKGHLRPFETSNSISPITLHWKEIRRWGWLSFVCLIKTHRLMCNMTFFGRHVTLNWSQIDLWLVGTNQYMFLSDSTRGTRRCHYQLLSLLVQKLFVKSNVHLRQLF